MSLGDFKSAGSDNNTITCNMGAHNLPDMYTLSPWASGIHIKQIPCAHVTIITYTTTIDSRWSVVYYCTVSVVSIVAIVVYLMFGRSLSILVLNW